MLQTFNYIMKYMVTNAMQSGADVYAYFCTAAMWSCAVHLHKHKQAEWRSISETPATSRDTSQFQALLRRKRRRYNQEQLHELCQLLRSDPRKFWQQVRLRTSLLPEQLRNPAAWVAYLTALATSPTQLAQDIPQPHLPPDTPAAHSLNHHGGG